MYWDLSWGFLVSKHGRNPKWFWLSPTPKLCCGNYHIISLVKTVLFILYKCFLRERSSYFCRVPGCWTPCLRTCIEMDLSRRLTWWLHRNSVGAAVGNWPHTMPLYSPLICSFCILKLLTWLHPLVVRLSYCLKCFYFVCFSLFSCLFSI